MQLRIFLFLAILSLLSTCKKEMTDPVSDAEYVQDNIFGCDQYEVMELEEQLPNNHHLHLENFHDLFLYNLSSKLIIKEGFNGPTLQTLELVVENLAIYNNELMICAEEGLYSLDPSGEVTEVSAQRCHTMILDGQNRLIVQGYLGDWADDSVFDLYEYKNKTLVHFAVLPDHFNCVSTTLAGGNEESFFAISCTNQIAQFKNGVMQTILENDEAPLFTHSVEPLIFHGYHNGGFIAVSRQFDGNFRMYRLVDQEWQPIYDLHNELQESEKYKEVFQYVHANMIIYNDYLYTFDVSKYTGRMANSRFDISGHSQKGWEDIELFQIPGLDSRDIIDVTIVSDGSAYAALLSKKMVKLTCN